MAEDSHWMYRSRWLTQALLISGALNIAFLATFVYFVLKEKKDPVTIELKPALQKSGIPLSNHDILRAYSTLSFQELLLRLENKDLVELGFSKRDIALACLVAFHHFNLERALGGLQVQQRKIAFSNKEGDETIDLTIFPGLADYQYQAIVHYAKTEKWPFTSQGLFFELKRSSKDPTLLEAFYLTPEFHAVSVLFAKSGDPLTKEMLIDLIAEGEWELLHTFTEKQREVLDLTIDRRRSFLLSFLSANSKTAAKLLLENEKEFIVKRLDDSQILALYSLIEKSPSLEILSKDLLDTPRSDAVLKKAAETLYLIAGELLPEPYEHRQALLRFLPEKAKEIAAPTEIKPEIKKEPIPVAAPAKETKTKAKAKKKHVVQDGDNLWKISRKYKVSIDSIKQANHLESDKLRPGKELEIPER